jgi:uncharacterized repeat protein (TIGR01451 family)
MSQTMMNQRLNQLLAPQRNNYYYGKLLDEHHFRKEQDYFNRKRWLLNRLGLGAGVLCGLQVTASKDGKQLCISPGVAVDALGREIIVPEAWCFDPWQITDECGHVKETLSRTEPHEEITICLAYNECYADYAPVLVTDCNMQEQCAPGMIRESFCVLVSEGTPDPVEVDFKLCDELNAPADTSSERRQNVCGATLGGCLAPSEKTCVVLATVALKDDGTIDTNTDIDTRKQNNCGSRTTVYSNAMLFDLILCLAERLEECCGKTTKSSISLTKQADVANYGAAGDVINYSLTVTNDGDVTLTNVSISDAKLTLTCNQPVTLAPGDSLTCTGRYTITQADLDAGLVQNTATASGTDPDGQPITSPSVSVTVPANQNSHLSLTKTANPTVFQQLGDVINYTLVVTNDGNVTLSNVNINDATISLTCNQPVDLPPGGSLNCTGSYTITQADLDAGFVKNTANGSATSPRNQRISAMAEITVTAATSPRERFKIFAVKFMGTKPNQVVESVIGRLSQNVIAQPNPLSRATHGSIRAIEIEFTHSVDPNTVSAAPANLSPGLDPNDDFSVLVQSSTGSYVPGTIPKPLLDPRIVRFVPDDSSPLTNPDVYTVTVYGDDGFRRGTNPYITDTSNVQLDGEPTQLPSGEDTPGGNFRFQFEVTA